jgi:hypothetical protein
VSDDKDELDPSDWLAAQFDPTNEIPKQKPAAPPPASVPEPVEGPPRFGGQPLAGPPQPTSQGGFNWGLRPGGSEPPAAPGQPAGPGLGSVPEPVEGPTPPAFPPAAPYVPPTTPYVPPTTPYVPPAPPHQAPPAYVPPANPYVPPGEPLVPPAPYVPPTPSVPGPSLVEPPPARMPNPSSDLPAQAMTQPMSWADLSTASTPGTPPPAPSGVDQPTEAYTVQPWDPFADAVLPVTPTPPPPTFGAHPDDLPPAEPTSALDALFGESQFQEYQELGVLQTMSPLAAAPADDVAAPPTERAPLTRNQKVLMWVAGSLVALLALVALFLLGQRLGKAQAAPPPAPASTTAPSSVPTAAPGTKAAPGLQSWSALGGGECIQPFSSAWAATFSVIDCGSPHDAQMLFKGTLPDAEGAPYPNGAQFQSEIQPLCTAPTVINYSAAKAVKDLQVSYSYPATSDDWDAGARSYYCFVNRESGDPLPGDLAAAKH